MINANQHRANLHNSFLGTPMPNNSRQSNLAEQARKIQPPENGGTTPGNPVMPGIGGTTRPPIGGKRPNPFALQQNLQPPGQQRPPQHTMPGTPDGQWGAMPPGQQRPPVYGNPGGGGMRPGGQTQPWMAINGQRPPGFGQPGGNQTRDVYMHGSAWPGGVRNPFQMDPWGGRP